MTRTKWITTAFSVLWVNKIDLLAPTAEQLETSKHVLRKFMSAYRARWRVTSLLANVFEYIPVRQILLKWEFYVFLQYFWLLFRSFLVQADQSICQCTLQCTPCQLAFESADLDVYFSPANTQCLGRDVFSFLLLSRCVSANIRGRPLFLCVLFPLSFIYAFHPFTFSYFSGEQGRVLVEKQMAYNWPDMGHIRPARMHARPYMQMSCYFPWFVCFSAFAISRYNALHIFPTASQSLSGKSNVQWQLAKIRRTDGRTGIDWKLFCNFCDCPPGRFDFCFFFTNKLRPIKWWKPEISGFSWPFNEVSHFVNALYVFPEGINLLFLRFRSKEMARRWGQKRIDLWLARMTD